MSHRIVVAPHPDDEVLGCSSVLTGPGSGQVTVVHVSHGVPPWIEGTPARDERRAQRIAESEAAWKILGADVDRISLDIDDLGVIAALDHLVEKLMAIVDGRPGATVYVPAYQRGHPDHDAVFVAALLARQKLGPSVLATWMAYALYGLDARDATRYGVMSASYFGEVRPAFGAPDELAHKHQALRAFTSQLRPESIVQQWLDDPQPEVFAPLPPIDRLLPELTAYYIEGMDLSQHGMVLDDTPDKVLRAKLAAASAGNDGR